MKLTVQTRLTPLELALADTLAARAGTSRSDLLRLALRDYLARAGFSLTSAPAPSGED